MEPYTLKVFYIYIYTAVLGFDLFIPEFPILFKKILQYIVIGISGLCRQKTFSEP